MRRLLILIITSFLAISLLAAWGDDSDEKDYQEVQNEQSEEKVDKEEEVDENESIESSSGIFEVTEKDQLDLSVGDTGVFQSTLGIYELTVETAEIVGEELDGEGSLLEELIVLDLTFKNVGDNVLKVEEIMHSMEITDDLDGSGYPNGASEFESIDLFEGELQPGEERTTQFIGDIYTTDEYYFRKSPGNVAAGTSNQVIWTIADEEARN